MTNLSPQEEKHLLETARETAQRAYAPYSELKFGAAVLTESGNVFAGCNVENASYGLTVCAERAAIFSAIAQEGGQRMKIRAMAIVNDSAAPSTPCGACRQVLFEFGPEAIILFPGTRGITRMSVKDLLPEEFHLTRKQTRA